MKIFILFLSILSLHTFAIGQKLTCPVNQSISCSEDINLLPRIDDGSGYTLEEERRFIEQDCGSTQLEITFLLVNDNDPSDIADQCSSVITITPYEGRIIFPADTVISGVTVNEVLGKTVLADDIFPGTQNRCNIVYSFEDEVVPLYPEVFIFRIWAAFNWCTGESIASRQVIRLTDIPEGSSLTSIRECNGTEIFVKDWSYSLNGEEIDLQSCTPFFDSLHHTINCLADSLLISDTDVLSLSSEEISDPLLGLKLSDLINIQRHILGVIRFQDDCSLYAADINRDGKITGADLVDLRKMYVGIYTEWPFGNGTKFTVNGVETERIEFTKSDFPLDRLDIIVSNKGNTTRN